MCTVELLTDLLSVRHTKGQVLSVSLSFSRAPQQQLLQQQVQQTLSSLCRSLSVSPPRSSEAHHLAEAMQGAASAIARQVRNTKTGGVAALGGGAVPNK